MTNSALAANDARVRQTTRHNATLAGRGEPGVARRPGRSSKASPLSTFFFAAAVLATLAYAWSVRLERHITAESGVGYALGIVGGVFLLIVLIYPLRKRWKSLQRLGSVPSWFRMHMVLGILGPALIILHSNFRLSAVNSTVAMFTMLTVAASGLVGRYLYTKIHLGLYGRKPELAELAMEADGFLDELGADIGAAPAVLSELRRAEATIFTPGLSLWGSIKTLAHLKMSRNGHRRKYLGEAQRALVAMAQQGALPPYEVKARLNLVREHLDSFQESLIKAADIRVYERLFSLWHLLHMPLFFLLILAAIVHIIAVHLY